MQLAAGAYNQRVAGEDDYDDDDAGPAAPAAAARAVQAQQQQQPQQAPSLQLPYGMAAAGVASSAQLQHLAALHQLQQQQPGMQLSQIQQLHLQQLQQQQQQQHLQQVSSLPSPVAAAVLQAAAQSPPPQQQQLRRPQLTPEQERLRELNKANTAQEAAQEALSFVYLDLDEMGEDIIHFSELFGFTDNMIKVGARQLPHDGRVYHGWCNVNRRGSVEEAGQIRGCSTSGVASNACQELLQRCHFCSIADPPQLVDFNAARVDIVLVVTPAATLSLLTMSRGCHSLCRMPS